MYYNKIDIKDGNNLAKSNRNKECLICHYWFLNHGFKFHNSVCNGCHLLTMLSVNVNDIVIITIKHVDYRCIILNISKFKAIDLLKNSALENSEYM